MEGLTVEHILQRPDGTWRLTRSELELASTGGLDWLILAQYMIYKLRKSATPEIATVERLSMLQSVVLACSCRLPALSPSCLGTCCKWETYNLDWLVV